MSTSDTLTEPAASGMAMLRQPEPVRALEVTDRAARAVDAIRAASLVVWYEPDRAVAREVARECPMCRVYSSHGHLRLVGGDDR